MIMGSASRDSNAFSRLPQVKHPSFGQTRQPVERHENTDSMGVSKPSTLPRSRVNLHKNENMKVVSQRSDGCFAFEGGHICPFLSDAAVEVAGMRENATARDSRGGTRRRGVGLQKAISYLKTHVRDETTDFTAAVWHPDHRVIR